MERERNLGVTEAGLGLTVVICLLLAVGYLVLNYVGGTRRAPAVEIRSGVAAEPAAREFSPQVDDEQPQVLTIESNDVPGQALRDSADSDLR